MFFCHFLKRGNFCDSLFIYLDVQGVSKTWTFFENAISPSFMEETFSKFSVVVANQNLFASMMFFYQIALLTGSDVIML